ncbi:uncharacterized protein LOC141852541 [Brevipalpus obovatus]|uniref:uncharacterized protein LOC141852541 n=1 Tax=Brevipalpus obovatus TaxID=246614 RepID=UPI003D9EABE4
MLGKTSILIVALFVVAHVQAAPQFGQFGGSGQYQPQNGQSNQPRQPQPQDFSGYQQPGAQDGQGGQPQGEPGFWPGNPSAGDQGEGIPMQPNPQAGPPVPPQISWGNCPQLKPSEAEMQSKASIIKSCLQSIPLPTNITQESVEKHRTDVAKCALAKEDWFDQNGQYRYEKAESEIKGKKLDQNIQSQIIAQHTQCRREAETQFSQPEAIIGQVQLYQACMDFHISQICQIRITPGQMNPAGQQ